MKTGCPNCMDGSRLLNCNVLRQFAVLVRQTFLVRRAVVDGLWCTCYRKNSKGVSRIQRTSWECFDSSMGYIINSLVWFAGLSVLLYWICICFCKPSFNLFRHLKTMDVKKDASCEHHLVVENSRLWLLMAIHRGFRSCLCVQSRRLVARGEMVKVRVQRMHQQT